MCSTKWRFTINNWTDEDEAAVKDAMTANKDVRYICFGKEVGEEKGTPHLQGFVYFKDGKNQRRKAVCTLLGGRANVDTCRGTPWENREYCKKDGDFWEDGTVPPERYTKKTTKNGAAAEVIEAYETSFEAGRAALRETMPMQYLLNRDRIERHFEPPKFEGKRLIVWHWGPTHCSKSWTAIKEMGAVKLTKTPHGMWNYNGAEIVVIDEVDKKPWISFDELLEMTDEYQYDIRCMGCFRSFNAHTIYFTASVPPDEYFGSHSNAEQLLRRIGDNVLYFNVYYHE